MRRSVVIDFSSHPMQCSGPCPRVGGLDGPPPDVRVDHRDEPPRARGPRKSLNSRVLGALSRGSRSVPEADRRRLVPQDPAGTASASPDSSPNSSSRSSSSRGPRLESTGTMDPGTRPVDYAEQMQRRWLDIARRMPQIVEDTYLLGGVPIYRPEGSNKNVGVILRPSAPLGLAAGINFH